MGRTPGLTFAGGLATLAIVLPLLAGCAGADGAVRPAGSHVESPAAPVDDSAADLETSAPEGRYAASYVLESANLPGLEPGLTSTSTYDFTLGWCSAAQCWGTVRAPVEGTYEWDGTELVVTFDELDAWDSCAVTAGHRGEAAGFRMHTQHSARATPARGGQASASRFEGTYQQETSFGDVATGCRLVGPDRQWARFSLVLERR